MIASISGSVTYKGSDFVIVEVAGIGYQLRLKPERVAGLGENVTLFTHEVVREDSRELFGFFTAEELELFWKLISVSGVGPKVGQKIVGSGEIKEVKERIMAGNLEFLTDIPGVGKKTGQKIILELKGVLAEEGPVTPVDSEALDALVNLGINKKQASEILAVIDARDTETRIREALKVLGK